MKLGVTVLGRRGLSLHTPESIHVYISVYLYFSSGLGALYSVCNVPRARCMDDSCAQTQYSGGGKELISSPCGSGSRTRFPFTRTFSPLWNDNTNNNSNKNSNINNNNNQIIIIIKIKIKIKPKER